MKYAILVGNYLEKVRIGAIIEGAKKLGYSVICCGSNLSAFKQQCDITPPAFCITCGMHYNEAPIRGYLKAMGIPLLVTDLGYFNRAPNALSQTGYYQVGLNKLNWVPSCRVNSSRFDVHNLTVADTITTNEKTALVLGQVPNDTQHQLSMETLAGWLSEKASYYAALGYKVIYRPHPKFLHMRVIGWHERSTAKSISDDLSKASIVVTYNSTGGVEALVAGVPVDCDSSAHYHGVSDLKNRKALMTHLHKLAWTQWTCEELRSGMPIEYTLDKYEHFTK